MMICMMNVNKRKPYMMLTSKVLDLSYPTANYTDTHTNTRRGTIDIGQWTSILDDAAAASVQTMPRFRRSRHKQCLAALATRRSRG